jgi:hypothetical protein
MRKFLVALAILGATSVPAFAQTTPTTTTPATTNQVQPAKPQMIKKRVCEQVDEDSYSRLGNRKICKTVEVPAEQPNTNTQSPTNNSSEHGS